MFTKNTHKNIKLFIAVLFKFQTVNNTNDRRVGKLLRMYLYNGILHRKKTNKQKSTADTIHDINKSHRH